MTREKMWEEFETGIIDVIERWKKRLEQEPKWIPIDADNMPKEHVEVLFTVAEGAWLNLEPAVLSGWFVSKYQEFEIDDEGRSVKLEDVTAWMPLPEPYRKNETPKRRWRPD